MRPLPPPAQHRAVQRQVLASVLAAVLALGLGTAPAQEATPAQGEPQLPPTLAAEPPVERITLGRLVDAPSWPRRALAAMRLERYTCAESAAILDDLRRDRAWQVRAFALRAIGRRRDPLAADALDTEAEPRIVRTALRHRLPYDPDRLALGVDRLADSRNLADHVLAAELAVAGGDDAMRAEAAELVRRVILRLGRADAARLSPRIATLTGAPDLRTPLKWQRWLRRDARTPLDLRTGHALAPGDERPPLSSIAVLDAERFAALETYLEELGTRKLDLAICIDCTASMSGELDAARAGVDDLMVFVGDVVEQLRIGLVAYRDRRDRDFETQGWDFTRDVEELRTYLWQLSAQGGGDRPEAVHPALEMAYTRLTWLPDSTKVLVVIGDAPPHVGLGEKCVTLAARAHEAAELVTHTIEAEGKPVEHFSAIAKAGSGRCVPLVDDDLLIAEVAGLALGERFEEEFRAFFAVYLELCR